MPTREETIRLLHLWKHITPGLPNYHLDPVHPHMNSDSPWVFRNHHALSDASKAVGMAEHFRWGSRSSGRDSVQLERDNVKKIGNGCAGSINYK